MSQTYYTHTLANKTLAAMSTKAAENRTAALVI